MIFLQLPVALPRYHATFTNPWNPIYGRVFHKIFSAKIMSLPPLFKAAGAWLFVSSEMTMQKWLNSRYQINVVKIFPPQQSSDARNNKTRKQQNYVLAVGCMKLYGTF